LFFLIAYSPVKLNQTSLLVKVVLCNATRALSDGNVAGYGDLAATDVYQLQVVRAPSILGSGEEAGHFTVETQDYYGQIVTENEGSSSQLYMFSSTTDSVSTLQGKTVVPVKQGVSNFTGLVFTLGPGQIIGVQFDFENINTTIELPIR
jgi:hypothetical protein